VPTKSASRSTAEKTKRTPARKAATKRATGTTKAAKKVVKKAARKSVARAAKAPARKATSRKATTAKKGAPRKATTSARTRRPDAIALLKDDHREVEQLFKRFERAGDSAEREKRRLVDSMTAALSKHAAIEEQVLYPWARDTVKGVDDEVLEAFEEHRIVKWLLTELTTMAPSDERFDARVTVMIELVRHHVKEEESELFPDLRDAAGRTELLELGDRLRAAKRAAPPVPDLGPIGAVGAAVEHARDVGKGVVDRIGVLTGIE